MSKNLEVKIISPNHPEFKDLLEEGKLGLGNNPIECVLRNISYPDVKKVREKTYLSQEEFAARLHIDLKKLQNWESRERSPTGSVLLLLRILDIQPELIFK
ncbi:helix-turn-helix domain-containing protein [Acinetobacter sp. LF10]|uniref:helix-turn-helix domain-containing protein n=1 Tax=Acinetobacter sp. LF10 TaxID=3403576 RepID=UPI003B213284